MIQSFSVIVPAYNCEKVIERTVDSIHQSIQFFRQHYPQSNQVHAEIIVVNDASKDQTTKVVSWLIQRGYPVKLVNHEVGRGAGATRNTGVKHSVGEILFFCDGDDLFLPEHIYVCYMILNHQPTPQMNADESAVFPLHYQGKTHQIPLPNQRVDVVKTGLRIRDSIHPDWKKGIYGSLTINLCVRRECHDFIDGYPEDEVYVKIRGREDCAYNQFLARLFNVATLGLETAEYVRYPGNSFDRQYETYQFPPGVKRTDISEEEAVWHQTASQLEKERLEALVLKRQTQPVIPAKAQISSWERINLNIHNQNYDFVFPRRSCMVYVVTDVFKGKDYPLVQLPNYVPHTILDIGANVGATAVYFHAAYPTAKIFCYEPSLENYQCLKENTKYFPNQIQAFHYGLFNQDDEVPLYQGATNTAQNSVMKSGETSQISEVIQLRNVKEELQRLNLSDISILKIDTEGCEIPILQELFNYTQNIDIIYLEYHSEGDRLELGRMLKPNFILYRMDAIAVHRGTFVYISRELADRYPAIHSKRIRPMETATI
jgi:FkbM family methyltransferase